MSLPSLELCEADDDVTWDAFVDQSPQGTVFSKTAFLHSLDAPVRRWQVQQAGQIMAQWAVVEDSAAPANVISAPYTPYQGILLPPASKRLHRQQVLDEFRLIEFTVKTVSAHYHTLEFALCWTFKDLRPFLWHHYGQASQSHFHARPRYTAILDLSELNPAQLTQDWRACRRQELRKASMLEVEDSANIDVFLYLYERTFQRQGLKLSNYQRTLARRITEASLAAGYGRLSACRTPQGTAAMSLFLYDTQRAYHLFAANEPTLRDSGAATRLMYDNILETQRRGLREVDFVGVNSPTRGDFKLSFNPKLQLYFELSYGPTNSYS